MTQRIALAKAAMPVLEEVEYQEPCRPARADRTGDTPD
jgi:hypothetical protein